MARVNTVLWGRISAEEEEGGGGGEGRSEEEVSEDYMPW